MQGNTVAAVALAWVLAQAGPAAAQSPPVDIATPPADAGAQPAANPAATDSRTVYEAAYFAQYAPATALQVVERVPGFSIEETDQNVRGFGQAAGNVVINGQRPSAKTDTLQTILARIPAGRVLRVEVGPGEAFGAEFSSKPQVLNLVMTAAAGLAGTTTATLRRDFTGKLLPGGSVSALARRGASSFNLSASITNERTSEEGFDRVFALPGETQVEYRRKVNRITDPNAAVTASWDYNGGANRTAHLNGRYAADRLALTQRNRVEPTAGAPRDDFLTQRYNLDDYELGGDVTRPFAGGGVKLIGLASRRERGNRDVSLNRTALPAAAVLGGFAQNLDDRLEEKLARLVWSRPKLGRWTVETGAEAVVNTLTSRVDLFGLGAGGAATRIDLPVDDATVRERRGEVFVNAGRPLAKAVRLDLGLTYETSHLTVRGDARADRTLSFLKPKATLDWRPAPWHAQLSVQRTVAQLQFTDFISSAELTNERVNGGNPDLVPQRASEALLTIERPVLGDGLVKLELGYNRVSLVQDRVPTPDGFDAPGNLGDGEVAIVRPRLDAPLGKLGIKGGRLTVYASYVHTSVRDPYTLRPRRFSGNSDFYGEVSLRQDRGKFAWGVTASGGTDSTFYRQNEIDSFSSQPLVSAFAEYRPDARTTVTLDLRNLTQAEARRTRSFFAPDRRTPAPFQREERVRNQHIVPALTLKRNFG